jgi:hypothetical protein
MQDTDLSMTDNIIAINGIAFKGVSVVGLEDGPYPAQGGMPKEHALATRAPASM